MIKRTDNELGKTRQKTNYLATQRSKGSMNKGHSVLYLISILEISGTIYLIHRDGLLINTS
jgi:hypothetical protein